MRNSFLFINKGGNGGMFKWDRLHIINFEQIYTQKMKFLKYFITLSLSAHWRFSFSNVFSTSTSPTIRILLTTRFLITMIFLGNQQGKKTIEFGEISEPIYIFLFTLKVF